MRTHTRRTALAVLAIVVSSALLAAQAPKVYATAHGKKYHTYRDCRALKSSSSVIELEAANVGDRTLCQICEHRKPATK